MAEQQPTIPYEASRETIDYKPLSLFAVAGFAVAVAYVLFLVVFGGNSLFRGEPFFVPGWSLFVPLGAAVLSGLGIWEIGNSEGTRAGIKLAKWGLGVGIVSGLAYFTYQTFTGLAITQQANRFVLEKDADSGFFPRLQGNDQDAKTAFLFTLTYNERSTVRPEQPGAMERFDIPNAQAPKGQYTGFLESHLVRILRQSPASTVKIEPLGVKDWAYENGVYKIVRTYRITTEDATYELPLLTTSQEAQAEGEKRKWKIDFAVNQPLTPVSRTAAGYKKKGLREKSFEFLRDSRLAFFDKLSKRQPIDAWLATQLPEDRAALLQKALEFRALTPLVAVAGATAPALGAAERDEVLALFLKGYRPLTRVPEYFNNLEDVQIMADADIKAKIKQTAIQTLSAERIGSHPFIIQAYDDLAPVEFKNGEVYVTHNFELRITLNEGGRPAPVSILGRAVVAASDKLDPSSPGADLQWRLATVELLRAVPVAQKQQ